MFSTNDILKFIVDHIHRIWNEHFKFRSETETAIMVEQVAMEEVPFCQPPLEVEAYLSDALPTRDHRLLDEDEAQEIIDQFKSVLKPGRQVMWTGVPRDWVQFWADEHGLQTLTTAMGPLMDPKHESCRKRKKSHAAWIRYVEGASELFAIHLPRGHKVTVLTRPPPYRFNPEGESTYQLLEEPVLKGLSGGAPVLGLEIVHFTVVGKENSRYQLWPVDEQEIWSRETSPFPRMALHECLKTLTRALHAYTLLEPILRSNTTNRVKIIGTKRTKTSASAACGLAVKNKMCPVSPDRPDACIDDKGKRQRVLPTKQTARGITKESKTDTKSNKRKQDSAKAGVEAVVQTLKGKKSKKKEKMKTNAEQAKVDETGKRHKKKSISPASPNVSETSKVHPKVQKEQTELRTASVKANIVVRTGRTNVMETKVFAEGSRKAEPKALPKLDIRKQPAQAKEQSAIDIPTAKKKKKKKTKRQRKRQSGKSQKKNQC